jgi:hypothetical protein
LQSGGRFNLTWGGKQYLKTPAEPFRWGSTVLYTSMQTLAPSKLVRNSLNEIWSEIALKIVYWCVILLEFECLVVHRLLACSGLYSGSWPTSTILPRFEFQTSWYLPHLPGSKISVGLEIPVYLLYCPRPHQLPPYLPLSSTRIILTALNRP